MSYNKFFASLIGVLVSIIAAITGSDFALPPGVLETIGGLAASVLVFIIPNIDEKGESAATKVDAALDKLRDFVNKLPDR